LAKNEDLLVHRWEDTNVQEMKKFIAVEQLMGMIRVLLRESDQSDHFGSQPLLKACVSDILPENSALNQFFQISEKIDKESSDREINTIKTLL